MLCIYKISNEKKLKSAGEGNSTYSNLSSAPVKHWFHITIIALFILIGVIRPMNVVQLKCEYKTNPLGIDEQNPRLSWILDSDKRGEVQTAYQILVASEKDKLSESSADMWNSGKILSRQSLHVVYKGHSLESRKRYFWKVRTWDLEEKPSRWSEIAWWEMALLNENDWKAFWINDGKQVPLSDVELYKEDPAPMFRKEFVLQKKVKQARLYITGLGYYEGFINGIRVGRHVLDPGWTNYSKRIYYSVYDVTERLISGMNCIGVTLGNGWYNPLPLRMWGRLNLREHLPIGRPRFIAQLEITYTDGSKEMVTSDQNWKCIEGPVLKNNIYLGEVYDARRDIKNWSRHGLNEENWHPVKIVKENAGLLQAQPVQPIRITGEFKVKNITQPSQGVYIIDMGQNFAGWASFRFNAPRGTEIRLRYGELLYEDGTLNPMTSVCGQIKGKRKDKNGIEYNIGGPGSPEIAWQGDTYITSGDGWEEYQPRFTFHAFRYIEITGYPGKFSKNMVTGLRLNSDVEEVGTFACSNQMFNDIQKMCQQTFLSNIFSVQSDCPHRERFGYGGDLVGTNQAVMYNYDMSSFYNKTVEDWEDAARDDGMFTDTAPFVGIQYCGIGWAMIHPMLQLNLYKYYGNRRIIEEQYKASRRWMEMLMNKYPDYIVSDGLSDHESINDTPAEQLVTPLYFYSAKMLARMANILDRSGEEKQYDELSENIRKAYLTKFFDKETGIVDPGTQTSQSFALFLDLIPDEYKDIALNYLEKNILEENQGHLSTGIMGTPFMLDVLCRNEREHIAYDIVNKKTFPGWGFMLKYDATTLWEHWEFSDNTYSHNHPMFGSVSQWFFNWLGGIQPAPDALGFDKIILRPQLIDDLQWVKTTYHSVRGIITSNWSKIGDKIMLEISIPVNAQAELYLPVGEENRIFESGMPIQQAPGVDIVGHERNQHIYNLSSGKFKFEIISKK
jgi:alpha-L-rhamnosidase